MRCGAPWTIAPAAALALAACAGDGAEPEAAAGPGYVHARTIQQLMAHVVEPTADRYWQAVRYVSDEAGEHDIHPETDEEWLATRTAAAALSEYGNLLMTPLYAEDRGKDWMNSARALVEIGLRAEQAAIDRDPEAVFDVGGTLYDVCSGCHRLYPPAVMPGDAPPEDAVRPTGEVSLDHYRDEAQ